MYRRAGEGGCGEGKHLTGGFLPCDRIIFSSRSAGIEGEAYSSLFGAVCGAEGEVPRTPVLWYLQGRGELASASFLSHMWTIDAYIGLQNRGQYGAIRRTDEISWVIASKGLTIVMISPMNM